MTIKEIELFLSVCKYGSMTTAAEKEYMSAQGLSNIIKRIEDELQVELFIRNPRGVKLTDYGEYFKERAKIIVKEYHDSASELLSMKAQKKGYIQLASAFGVIRHLSPEFIFEFQQAYPDMKMDYIELPDLLVESYVRENKADVGFTPNPSDEEFECIPLFSSKLYFIAHTQSKLYNKDKVSIKDIASEPLVIESSNFQINRLFKEECLKHKVEPHIFFETSGFSLCYKMCNNNEANTLTIDFIFDDMKYPNMKLIEIDQDIIWTVYFIVRKNTVQSKAIQCLLEFVQNWLQRNVEIHQ